MRDIILDDIGNFFAYWYLAMRKKINPVPPNPIIEDIIESFFIQFHIKPKLKLAYNMIPTIINSLMWKFSNFIAKIKDLTLIKLCVKIVIVKRFIYVLPNIFQKFDVDFYIFIYMSVN